MPGKRWNTNEGRGTMTMRAHLSAQVYLVDAAEQLREAQGTIGEGNKELVDRLDSTSSDIGISSVRSDATDERDVDRWQERQSVHN